MKIIFWNVLLFVATLLFFIGLNTDKLEFYVGALIVGIFVRIVGFENIVSNNSKK